MIKELYGDFFKKHWKRTYKMVTILQLFLLYDLMNLKKKLFYL